MARHALIHRDHETERSTDGRVDTRPEATDERTGGRVAERRRTTDDDVVALAPHDTFGGTNWGACFFGWLVALGVTALLALVVGAVATVVGTQRGWALDDAESHARSVGLAAAIAVTAIVFVGYYAGGYVAGRMSRFDGVRQGVGVWLIGVLTTAIALGLAALAGTRSDLLPDVDLSPGDLTGGEATTGAAVTAAAVLVVMLVGAVLGSAMGRRYHRRVDAVVVGR